MVLDIIPVPAPDIGFSNCNIYKNVPGIRYEVPGAYGNILGQRTPGRINSLGENSTPGRSQS